MVIAMYMHFISVLDSDNRKRLFNVFLSWSSS